MKNLILLVLYLLSTTVWANDDKLLDLSIQIEDSEGRITIIQEKNGKQNTIEESFAIDDKTDVDQVITDILKEYDIDMTPKMPKPVQFIKSKHVERIDVEVIDDTAHITFTEDDNGSVKVIKESIKTKDNVELSELIEGAARKHIIGINPNKQHQIIKVDPSLFTNTDADRVYYGFLAVVEDRGWQVITVIPDSGAEKAGLQEGDLIIEVNGKKTGNSEIELKNLSKQAKAGQQSTFKIRRDDKLKSLEITAQKSTLRDAVLPPIPPTPPSSNGIKIIPMDGDRSMTPHIIMRHNKLQDWLGDNHQLITVNPGLEPYFGVKQGVLIVNIRTDNKLALVEGDVILSINDKAITTPKQAVKALSALNLSDGFVIEVMRKKEKVSIAS